MSAGSIGSRKRDHIRICLDDSSQFEGTTTGFERYRFLHDALPEMKPEDVDLSTEFLGKRLEAPLLVSSMTGGPDEGARINRHLAQGAAANGLGMAVGSQRIAIIEPSTRPSFEVRPHAADILLFANLGAVQLNYGFGVEEAKLAVEMIGADGLFLHVNALQEVVQAEGDTDFSGLLDKIQSLCASVPFPVLVKECGAGISGSVLSALWRRGVAAVDVSGAGGTSWSKVEALRAHDARHRSLGETFADWGIPTADAVRQGRAAEPHARIIASGGIRNGIDIAKALALGADVVSIAQPVLAAALKSGEAVAGVLSQFILELRTVCFLVGARNISDLRRPNVLCAL